MNRRGVSPATKRARGRSRKSLVRRDAFFRRLCVEPLEDRRMLSVVPQLVADINPLPNSNASNPAQLSESFGRIPLSFEANEGQADPRVNFLSRGSGYSVFLTAGDAVLSLQKAPAPATAQAPLPGDAAGATAATQIPPADVLDIQLVGANLSAPAKGLDRQASVSNYLIGNDPAQWHTNIANYGKVEYQEVYPGVDLVYYGNQRQLEYDFVVAPGADPAAIRLAFKGADTLKLDPQGDLIVHTAGGELVEHAPVVYQQLNGGRQAVAGRFVLEGSNQVAFQVGSYDAGRALVIDPVLGYSTYLGGSYGDCAYGIAVDGSGNAYVTGVTSSTNFPTTPGAFRTTYGGGSYDAFVTKLNASGTALVYSTYLGGSYSNYAYGIAVDGSGDAYVTGVTSSTDLPTTAGAFQTSYGGGLYDAFLSKLNASGTALLYSTYLGGSNYDYGAGIAVDGSGNAYVTGYTSSTNFPTTAGAFQTSYGGGTFDAFVTKLNASGTALVYSTYLGGNGYDAGLPEHHAYEVTA